MSTPTVTFKQYSALQHHEAVVTPLELFEFQVGVLQQKGFNLPDTDVDLLRMLVPAKPQLFLIVPNRPAELDLSALMVQVEVDSLSGRNELMFEDSADVIYTPPVAHFLLDVEDGRERLNISPKASFKNISRECRIPYTMWYGIIHASVFGYVLQNHSLDLVGSRGNLRGVPSLRLDNGIPELYEDLHNDPHEGWGAPSAERIVGA